MTEMNYKKNDYYYIYSYLYDYYFLEHIHTSIIIILLHLLSNKYK